MNANKKLNKQYSKTEHKTCQTRNRSKQTCFNGDIEFSKLFYDIFPWGSLQVVHILGIIKSCANATKESV